MNNRHNKKTASRRYMQNVQRDRNRFYVQAQKIFYAALMEQMRPVFFKVSVHESSHSLEHLIKDAPMIAAFKLVYTDVGNHFARVQFMSLLGIKSMKAMTGPTTGTQSIAGDAAEAEEDDFAKLWRGQVSDFIEGEGAEMVANINDSTRDMVKTFLSDAIKNGTPGNQLAASLRDHWTDLSRTRAMTISRNEVNRAQNFATNEGAEMTGLTLVKTWVHSGGGDTDRPDHADADGQTVDFEDTFDIGDGYTPMYPHDGSGGPEDEINCNCAFYNTRKK